MAFVNRRISLKSRLGTSFSESFSVQRHTDVGGNEYSKLQHPFPRLEYTINYANMLRDTEAREIIDLYQEAGGTYAGFRVKHKQEFTTNDKKLPPTALDQPLIVISPTQYQLVTWYGTPTPEATRRIIKKPVTGTALIAVDGVLVEDGFVVDYGSGVVTFDEDPDGVVTGGCEFDIPMRFAADYSGTLNDNNVISSVINIIEIFNP
jgi:uncharacterized protein (TIGR02217 family)